ncbi:RNA methyltransferase [Sphingomonas yunnanensis]|uniref:TrmH family RNA methyltransferase n=1 Tax=Sphingomonas yunnanensis TaxID=310400 RepID=UPI001CA66E00|nr:RNA methyltransferase [Sphingomonas yunnanensis]
MPQLIPIVDPADPRVEPYRDIRERDLVGRRGLFVAEGVVVLEKLVESATHRVASLLIADKRADALSPLLARLPADTPVYLAAPRVLDAIAGFPLHRGVLAIGQRGADLSAGALLGGATPPRDVLLLSAIANHDNMGGIFRNAAAFGVGAILLDADCCDPLYRKAIRVSVGAALTVPFARLGRDEDALALLAHHGFEAVALSPAGAMSLPAWRPAPRSAVLLGAEGPGLAPALMARARTLRIAMAAGFDSLNVATTSGIVLHHLATARAEGA